MPTYRLYYNNSTDPQHWSLDEGTPESEVCVMGVMLHGVEAHGVFDASMTPKAWLEVTGELRIAEGIAHLSAPPRVVSPWEKIARPVVNGQAGGCATLDIPTYPMPHYPLRNRPEGRRRDAMSKITMSIRTPYTKEPA